MLHPLEAAHRLPDGIRPNTQQPRRAHRRQHVLQVVLAFQANEVAVEHAFPRRPIGENDGAVFHIGAHVHAPPTAEPEPLRPDFRRQVGAERIVGVEDGEVLALLVAEQPRLRCHVLAHGGVAVEVVRRDVQQRRHSRAETADGLKLEAAHFHHVHRLVGSALHQSNERGADVAPHLRPAARLRENAAQQRGGGGLSVRTSDRNHRPAQEAPSQLQLADDLDSLPPRFLEHRQVERNAGAGHDEFRAQEGGLAVAAAFNSNPSGAQLGRRCGHFFFGAQLAGRHLRSVRRQELRRGHTRTSQANHHRPFARQFHRLRHRSFSVLNENSAKTRATIQKRMMIFDSAQPFSSKWWCSGAIRKMRFPRN